MHLTFMLGLANFFCGENGSEKCRIFIILTFYDFRTMLPKYLCDEVSKIKNPRCTFSSNVHADPQEIFFICHFQPFLVENLPRKRANFIFFIISWYLKISQYVFHKSVWQSFQKKSSEMYIFFLFPCWSSWDIFCLQYPSVSAGKLT